MTVAMRPMNLGEILDRTFQIYKSRFWVFVGIAALGTAASLSINFADSMWFHVRSLLPAARRPSGTSMWNALVWLGFYHIHSLLHSFFTPALVWQASSGFAEESCSFRHSLRLAFKRWRGFLWIGFLKVAVGMLAPETLVALVVTGAAAITYAVKAPITTPIIVLIVFLPAAASLILAQFLGASLSLSFAAGTIEDLRGMKALRRSWALSRGRRWPIQLTWIAVFLSYYLLSLLSQATLQWGWLYGWRAFHPQLSRVLYTASYYALYEALGSLIGPIFPIVATLFYYDQRIRNEGYDIERMMDAAGLNESHAPVEALSGDSVSHGGDSVGAEVQAG
jgi:hypothetical protein